MDIGEIEKTITVEPLPKEIPVVVPEPEKVEVPA